MRDPRGTKSYAQHHRFRSFVKNISKLELAVLYVTKLHIFKLNYLAFPPTLKDTTTFKIATAISPFQYYASRTPYSPVIEIDDDSHSKFIPDSSRCLKSSSSSPNAFVLLILQRILMYNVYALYDSLDNK